MKLTEPNVELWKQEQSLEGMYAHIERCARICYRSENKGKNTSEEFVKNVLIKRDHGRPLEFGTIVFKQPTRREMTKYLIEWAKHSPRVEYIPNESNEEEAFIVTNLRFIVELFPDEWEHIVSMADWDLPENFIEEVRPTVHWHLSRGIGAEFRTHVTLSSLMESTRYVNYNKKGMDFARPQWYSDDNGVRETAWRQSMERSEADYTNLLRLGLRPEQARGVLPLDLATNLAQCGFNSAWDNFFYRRRDAAAHEDARYLADSLYNILRKDK